MQTLSLDAPPKDILSKIKEVVLSYSNAKITKETDSYLHAEFTSEIFGFVDDVEFLIKGQSIFARSASRVGYSDMGVNRERLTEIFDRLK